MGLQRYDFKYSFLAWLQPAEISISCLYLCWHRPELQKSKPLKLYKILNACLMFLGCSIFEVVTPWQGLCSGGRFYQVILKLSLKDPDR